MSEQRNSGKDCLTNLPVWSNDRPLQHNTEQTAILTKREVRGRLLEDSGRVLNRLSSIKKIK